MERKFQKTLTISALLEEVNAITDIVPRLPATIEKRVIATLIDRFYQADNECYLDGQGLGYSSFIPRPDISEDNL